MRRGVLGEAHDASPTPSRAVSAAESTLAAQNAWPIAAPVADSPNSTTGRPALRPSRPACVSQALAAAWPPFASSDIKRPLT